MVEYDDENPHAEASFMSHGGGGATDHERDDNINERDDAREHDDEEAGGPQKKKRVLKSRKSLSEKAQGTTLFPMARVKRIIKSDKELDMMSNEATFLVAVATEYFIKHFMEEGYTKARIERRKIVNYKDMANAVSRNDEFDFLRDVVPLPVTLSEALEKRKARLAAADDGLHGFDDDEGTGAAPSGSRKRSGDAPPQREEREEAEAENDDEDAGSEQEEAENDDEAEEAAEEEEPEAEHERSPSPEPAPAPKAAKPRSKRQSGSSAQPSGRAMAPPKAPVSAPARPPLTGKNAPSTPHSLTTRSGRRSMNAADAEPMQVD